MAKQWYIVFGDDGHGANTPGKTTPYIKSLGRSIKENVFNKAVVALMKKFFEDTEVIFIETAPTDADVPLNTRTSMANRIYKEYCEKYGEENVHAVFVSVHYNALDGKFDGEGKDPEGHSVHIYPGSVEGRKLADSVRKFMVQGTIQKDRGIVQQNLAVTRNTDMPAILTENGFMDNEKEAVLMIDEHFQLEVANEHFKGILAYFGIEVKKKPAPKPVAPKPTPAPTTSKLYKDFKTDSLVDFLNLNDVDASFGSRTELAKKYGINGYAGTADQNVQLLEKLRSLVKPAPKPVAPKPAPAPSKLYKDIKTGSLVDFLKLNGLNPSFGSRIELAKKYGINGYEGTADQNVQLLEKLRSLTKQAPKPAPKPAPKGDMKTGSLVDYLKSIGVESNFGNRAKLASRYGIRNYTGSPAQNTLLLDKLR